MRIGSACRRPTSTESMVSHKSWPDRQPSNSRNGQRSKRHSLSMDPERRTSAAHAGEGWQSPPPPFQLRVCGEDRLTAECGSGTSARRGREVPVATDGLLSIPEVLRSTCAALQPGTRARKTYRG